MKSRPTLVEALGLSPPRERLRQARTALAGAEHVPPSRYDRSSLSLVRPSLGLPLWRGRFVVPRKVVLTNLFNHRQTPVEQGWSVRRTQVEDFRGRGMTYDSHNGTDLCVPVGTVVCAAAPGRVVRVWSEFNRGGLKIAIDHGDGLITSAAHLARPLVSVGQVLRRGEPYALSGYSGLDGFVTFPFGVPHVHFNVWLDGVPVDPFARRGADEPPLWRGGEDPRPAERSPGEAGPTPYDEAAVDDAIGSCLHAETRERLGAVADPGQRGAALVSERAYYPTRFPRWIEVHAERHPRRPILDLPFSPDAVDGAVFADELPDQPR